jgi:hypothetical protein
MKKFFMQLVGTDDSEIGAIKKKYRGYVAEALTSADTYSVEGMKSFI